MGREEWIVIGSGPSGTACASALLAQGRAVRMLDAGVRIEPEKLEAARAVRAGVDVLRPAGAPWMRAGDEEIPRKLLFGSDFPFRDASEHLRLESAGVGLEPSFARGGFSNIWGASVMPYADRDIASWPIRAADLEPHYQACAKMLGFSGETDDLADAFPLYAEPAAQLRAGAQVQGLLCKMARNRVALNRAGLSFGRARVAIRGDACVYCGLCLGGCPDNFIFSTNAELDRLAADPNFSYQPGVVVDAVREAEGAALIEAHDLHTNAPLRFTADRVFLAAGVIPTTAILMRSGGISHARIKDSQYFLLPLLMPFGAGDVMNERAHTLAQAFIELFDEKTSPYTTHLQVYGYNSFLGDELRKQLRGIEPLVRAAASRLILIQGYLHSDLSSAIDVTLEDDRVRMAPAINARTKREVGRVVGKLMANAHRLGAVPVPPLMRLGEPGRGFHSGGSFPMAAEPSRLETDTLGRPFGWSRVHAVDATVLPSIAATTITFPVMANAHRIATQAAALHALDQKTAEVSA